VGNSLSPEARAAAIRKLVTAEFAKGTALPVVRKKLAAKLGGIGADYLGTADPVYYRLAGLATPLTDGKGKPLGATPTVSVLRSAVRRRRDSGVRWETLAASAEASLGRTVSKREVLGLYVAAGGDPEASYVGRGTRRAAPKTRGAAEVAVEATLEA
jgi:hypothetical protein